jgi:transposase
MPIEEVTRKKRETTTEERVSVIEKNAEGKSYLEIAEIAGISKPHVSDIVKEWQHNIEDSDRSGRSSKPSDSDIRYPEMISDKDASVPLAEITRDRVLLLARTLPGEH